MESTQASLLRSRTDDLAITLAILRIIRRWSQSELADAAGVTNSAISDYERGKVDPQTQTLRKLIRALGLPLSALDQTQAFIQTIQAQMSADDAVVLAAGEPAFSAAGGSPALRARRVEIAQAASDAGRCASRLVQLLLEGPLGGLPETP
jgi:transcriptional regulator with XRE-family HTH domain